MSIIICDELFQGPFAHLNYLEERPGVYAVLGGDRNLVLEIDSSAVVHSSVSAHERARSWHKFGVLPIKFAVLYCDCDTSIAITKEFKEEYTPFCENAPLDLKVRQHYYAS